MVLKILVAIHHNVGGYLGILAKVIAQVLNRRHWRLTS